MAFAPKTPVGAVNPRDADSLKLHLSSGAWRAHFAARSARKTLGRMVESTRLSVLIVSFRFAPNLVG